MWQDRSKFQSPISACFTELWYDHAVFAQLMEMEWIRSVHLCQTTCNRWNEHPIYTNHQNSGQVTRSIYLPISMNATGKWWLVQEIGGWARKISQGQIFIESCNKRGAIPVNINTFILRSHERKECSWHWNIESNESANMLVNIFATIYWKKRATSCPPPPRDAAKYNAHFRISPFVVRWTTPPLQIKPIV